MRVTRARFGVLLLAVVVRSPRRPAGAGAGPGGRGEFDRTHYRDQSGVGHGQAAGLQPRHHDSQSGDRSRQRRSESLGTHRLEGRTAPQGQGGIRKEGRARARRGKQRPAVPLRDPAGDRERDIHLHGRPVRRGGQDAQLHRLPRGDRHTPGAPQSARRGASTGRQARPAVHPPDRAGGHGPSRSGSTSRTAPTRSSTSSSPREARWGGASTSGRRSSRSRSARSRSGRTPTRTWTCGSRLRATRLPGCTR